jgi:hypothetical protein
MRDLTSKLEEKKILLLQGGDLKLLQTKHHKKLYE